jgi:hypothetical protein
MKRLALSLAVLALAGCGSTKPQGFLDHTQLEAKIKAAIGTATANDQAAYGIPAGTTVTDVGCIRSVESKRLFECRITASTGDSITRRYLVSEDGSSAVLSR